MWTIKHAEKCAWRAVYLYRGAPSLSNPPVARLGIDPTAGPGPVVFMGLAGRSLRFTVPHVRWATAWRFRRLGLLALYRLQQRALHRLDGRYAKEVR